MEIIRSIQNRIYELRGERVMLDYDLASMYEVATKVLNQAVKRNIRRFPEDFMFRLNAAESVQLQSPDRSNALLLRSQIVTSNSKTDLNAKSPSAKNSGGVRYLPFAFTEQGIAMLSGVLKSEKAINMNIAIMRAFVQTRRLVLRDHDLKSQILEIKDALGMHDSQLTQIYDALENLMDEKASQKKWEDRERIGFKKN